MSQNCVGVRSYVAGEALAIGRRVKVSAANTVIYTDADEVSVGVTVAAVASGAMVPVAPVGGTSLKICACAAVTAAAAIYGRADGKVDDAGAGSGSAVIGVALEAALADGDIIECVLY